MNTTTFERAQAILGPARCIGPEVLLTSVPQIATNNTRTNWSEVPFSEETLIALRDDYILIAGFPFTINELNDLFPDLFIQGFKKLSRDKKLQINLANEKYARETKV